MPSLQNRPSLQDRIASYPPLQRQKKEGLEQRVLTIRLPDEEHSRLKRLARHQGVSINWLARSLLSDGSDRLDRSTAP